MKKKRLRKRKFLRVLAVGIIALMLMTTSCSNKPATTTTTTATTSPGVTQTTTAVTTTATPSPTTSVTTAVTTTTTTSQTVTINLIAENLAFNMSTITVARGSSVTVNFTNRDSGFPHNFAVYTNSGAATTIFKGNIITGPSSTVYTFTAPSTPGTYFFRCDPHFASMNGSFIVQ